MAYFRLPERLTYKRSPTSTQTSPSCDGSTETPTMTEAQEEQFGEFMKHLSQWAANHETSTQFHGKVGVLTKGGANESFELGKPVKCVVSHADSPELRKQIVVRLFPPRAQQTQYSLVVRCGSGWLSAREFFNKEHLARLRTASRSQEIKAYWSKHSAPPASTAKKSEKDQKPRERAVVPMADDKDSVVVGPVFHRFVRLPQELQDMIWVMAAGLTGWYRPCRHRTSDYPVPHIHENYYPKQNTPVTLGTMLSVSKSVNEHMVPWVYRTTNFYFELTGFTNFLWQSGPRNRANLRRVTFKFSSLALLHCHRWLAPDEVFELFDPPAYTSPHGLQYFWRCQIQELARDLHLHTLTLDLHGVPPNHVPMMVRILRQAFGSVRFIRFVHEGREIGADSWRLAELGEPKTWRELCRGWFESHHMHQGYMSDKRRGMSLEDLERDMDERKEFFDAVEDGAGGVQAP